MKLERELNASSYSNESTGFLVKEKNFSYQYAPLYAQRLAEMRNELRKAAEQKWRGEYKIKNLVDLEKNEKSIIIGTLYKEMKYKPSILLEVADDENGMIQPVVHRDKYTDPNDQLILEDELQRIALTDPPNHTGLTVADKFCTGLVIALFGYEDESSKFVVEDYCFKNTPYLASPKPSLNEDKYIVFVSGIELGDAGNIRSLLKFQLLTDLLSGDFSDQNRLDTIVSKTCKIVIAGNSLSASTQSKDMHRQAKYLTKNFVAGSVSAMKQLDEFILQLSSKLDVDLMPGTFDPSNLMLPQQPLHYAMFSKSSQNKTSFRTVTNPYKFKMDGVSFLGTSGQLVDDIRKCTEIEDSIELMKLTIDAGHLGPTCPDTLACYPFYARDPLILSELPDVYFTGCQQSLKTETHHSTNGNPILLISLPRFAKTFSCVFLNLKNLQVEEFFF